MLSNFEIKYLRYGFENTTIECIEHSKEYTEEDILRKVNIGRLRGFEDATIKLISAKFESNAALQYVDSVDLEDNSIFVYTNLKVFLEECVTRNFLEELQPKEDESIEELLEALGYEEVLHDNTYNYESSYDGTIDYKVFQHTSSDSSDYLYDKEALIFARLHVGLDVRCGYIDYALFKNDDDLSESCDGFLSDLHFKSRISFYLYDEENCEEVETFDDTTGYLELNKDEYQIIEATDYDYGMQVRRLEDNKILELRWS